ncbi:tryptophan--tRNA ligase [Criibacterium bergeronii]|uniref:Tryptophan--tRNA ligase n=1 Tax=Criibacterium bergeronii TaxID=1871336 RepID=A0A552V995_9FIRM|nr:tryptophan--tRNA ligase [Criibacterium bergeronii]TRW27040.1 tryptophan--tRNA ligase [Criibacterium bergeronii]
METEKSQAKKRIFSGVQPSGELTIGNYLGAIKNWVDLQDEYECFYCIVDEHAITVPQEPAKLRKRSLEVLAKYIAGGVDPDKSTLFIQSHVPQHAQLMWVLNSIAYMGELSRMTQYKDKSRKSAENLNAALFTYPVLMAADILLYSADLVPVGIDQKQHLEIARTLAERFNNKFSPTFVIPDIYTMKETAKIMSLQDASKKMSKSDDNLNGFISMVDENDVINSKIKKAVTDSVGQINYSDEQPEIKNLINIYCAYSHKKPQEVVDIYQGKNYADFKKDLAQVVVEGITPIREKYNDLLKNKDYLKDIYKKGAQKAGYEANKMISKVYRKIGFIEHE